VATVGVRLAGGGGPGTLAAAAAVVDAGADELWVVDQTPPAAAGAEPFTLLGALAVRTAAVTLGVAVPIDTGRAPALIAKQTTTVDVLSGGRAALAFGLTGAGPPPAGDAAGRQAEMAAICRAMFRHEEPTVTGRHFRIDRAANRPRPVRVGGPRLLVALPAGDPPADVDGWLVPADPVSVRAAAARRPAGIALIGVAAVAVDRSPRAGPAPGGPAYRGDAAAVTAAVADLFAAGLDGVIVDGGRPDPVDVAAVTAAVRAARAAADR